MQVRNRSAHHPNEKDEGEEIVQRRLQSPFLSVFMYLDETTEYREELAMLIKEFLDQRIAGMKNDKGVPVTVAFPKLLYCLSTSNAKPGSEYYWLTELAAKCSAKRLVPKENWAH